MVPFSTAKNSSVREASKFVASIIDIGGMARTRAAARERCIEREWIAGEGEAGLKGEVDLIGVAGGDVVLNLGKGARVLLARPGKLQVRDGRALERAIGIKPAPRLGIGEADGLAEKSDPE